MGLSSHMGHHFSTSDHKKTQNKQNLKIWTASKTVVRLRASGKHVKEGQKIYIHEFCDHVTLNNPMTFNVMTQKCIKPSKDILCCYHGNNDSTHTKNKWLLHNTITYLYAKFEVNRRRNA